MSQDKSAQAQQQQDTTPDGQIDTQLGRSYWQNVDADVNGMLGGFASISRIDLQGSRTFLAKFGIGTKAGRKSITSAVEGGAGIGRITKGLLLPIAEHVDVVEPISKFTDALRDTPGVRQIFNVGLEEWQPAPGAEYDLVWTQWCLGHLTGVQVVQYLKLCKTVLRPESGLIVVKENMSTSGVDIYDEVDSSVTRQDESFRGFFEEAGLRVMRTELQRGLPQTGPDRLFPVRMYALKPR